MIDMRKKNIKILVFAPSGNLNFFTLSKKKIYFLKTDPTWWSLIEDKAVNKVIY